MRTSAPVSATARSNRVKRELASAKIPYASVRTDTIAPGKPWRTVVELKAGAPTDVYRHALMTLSQIEWADRVAAVVGGPVHQIAVIAIQPGRI